VAQAVQAPAEYEVLVDRMARIPSDATIGIVGDEHDPDYLLYGPKLGRTVVWLPHDDPLGRASCGLRWIYVGRLSRVPAHPAGWRSERIDNAGTLLTRTRPETAC
jgi:hypothetical protein